MNCKEAIVAYMREEGFSSEFTASSLAHRVGGDDGPRYEASTIRNALNELHKEGLVAKRSRRRGAYWSLAPWDSFNPGARAADK